MALLFGSATLATAVQAAPPKAKGGGAAAATDASKKQKEIGGDGMQKQMDWEKQILGSSNEKKIDLAKIQKLQAEEAARREKQEKIDKDKKEREAAMAAQRKDVKQPSSHEVPEIIEEAPKPAPKAEKHDDAFVDKLLKDKGAPQKKKSASVTNDEVDQLLAKSKEDKPAAAKTGRGKSDGVDALLAAADKQAPIKTHAPKPAETADPVSAEVAAREATRKALAAAAAQRAEEEKRKRPAIPDAAMMRAQHASAAPTPAAPAPAPAAAKPAPRGAGWADPFAAEGDSSSRTRVNASTTPGAARRSAPAARPAASDSGWQDPFDSGGSSAGSKRHAPAPKAAPAAPAKPAKPRPATWSDPFA